MIHSLTVLAQLSEGGMIHPGGVVLIGFLFVILVLVLLAALTSIMGAWFTKQAAASAAKAAEAAQATADAVGRPSASNTEHLAAGVPSSKGQAADSGEDPALIAVISAAVHTVIGDRPHRVVSIRSAGPGWAQEGRRQIFSSHRVR